MQDLRLTLIQSELHWESPEANLAMFEEKLWQIGSETDLIILPEMFTTGFTMNTRLWEHPNGKTVNWLKKQAEQFNAAVTGSVIIKDNENYYNRLVWALPDGQVYFYDKRHLFRMAEEDKYFSEGKERLVIDYKGWKILPMICYDLRFPVWMRNGVEDEQPEYDLIVVVANWPAARVSAWQKLLQARAIENLSYVAAVNRTGEDGNQIPYNGASAVIDFKGDVVMEEMTRESIFQTSLDKEALDAFRRKFPAWKDRDQFNITGL